MSGEDGGRPRASIDELEGRVSAARAETEARGETFYPGASRVHLAAFPPKERWSDWVELDSKAWPERVERRFMLVPTTCFNCESACGLLAYVDRETLQVRKFEGNPEHPGSRGRNCAKGPATVTQLTDPDRILTPLKRVGERGEGKWEPVDWDEALDEIAARIRTAMDEGRHREIMYHVGRPGEDGFTERMLAAWGVDGHNSHTNICSSGARAGYHLWMGMDRPSPDHENARVILLVSSHLEAGHYFNPHAQRVMEGKRRGAKLIVFDTRLSNTATHADHWLSTWPGSEAAVLLAIANHLIRTGRYNADFVRRWWNWREFLENRSPGDAPPDDAGSRGADPTTSPPGHVRSEDAVPETAAPDDSRPDESASFERFQRALASQYSRFTFDFAAAESGVPAETIAEVAEIVAGAGARLSTHNWRSAAAGNLGGWQVARALFLLNALTGSIAVPGGTYPNAWNKFVPRPIHMPPRHPEQWNELSWPADYPLSLMEMSFLLPHLTAERNGRLDVYFTRVYNPVWTNPDGFSWIEMLTDPERIGLHVALTPTWNETAFLADYVLPMGHSSERHDLTSYEQYDGLWIGFRQPVLRAARERLGEKVGSTREVNPGEVWEENEFWIELTWRIDPDGSRGIRRFFESRERPGEKLTVDEYYGWIFANSVPGLPERAAEEGLSPLDYMRRYGAFEIGGSVGSRHEERVPEAELEDWVVDGGGRVFTRAGAPPSPNVVPMPPLDGDEEGRRRVGVEVDGALRRGFPTPSGRLEFWSRTLADWGWPEMAVPGYAPSHVHRERLGSGRMCLISTFRLPVQIHTRSANAKWLNEIAHTNPLWLHPRDAARIGVRTGDLVRVETQIGHFVVKAWVTEGIHPGVVACSHHMGRWKTGDGPRQAMATVALNREGTDWEMKRKSGTGPFSSPDGDTARIWWTDVGVHQNMTFPVQPDPVSGAHCWHQAVRVVPARSGDRYGDIVVDTARSREAFRRWLELARPARRHSPDGTRRPWWLLRPVRPVRDAYALSWNSSGPSDR